MFDHVQPMLLVKMEQDLGVRVGAKDVPARSQLSSQFAIVVNFAVERDDQGGLGGSLVQGHRLNAIGTEVDDREAATGQSQSAVKADPLPHSARAPTDHGSRNPGNA